MSWITRLSGLRAGVVALGFVALAAGGQPARAVTPEEVAGVLQSRNWFEDYGSFGSQVFGRVAVFGPAETSGWYRGSYVTYKGAAGSTVLGMAWMPFVSGDYVGVVIDYAYTREIIFFTGSTSTQLHFVRTTNNGASFSSGTWTMTRSTSVPYVVRTNYYK